jgi:hypothetical protein
MRCASALSQLPRLPPQPSLRLLRFPLERQQQPLILQVGRQRRDLRVAQAHQLGSVQCPPGVKHTLVPLEEDGWVTVEAGGTGAGSGDAAIRGRRLRQY